MHWTRQQRRLLYTLGCFFIMSLYFVKFAGLFQIPAYFLRILALVALVVFGKVCHQEALPWEIPLYFILISLLGLFPFQRIFGGFAYLAIVLSLVALSLLYVYVLQPARAKELFTGNLREVFESPWSYPKKWYQVIPLFLVVNVLYFLFRHGEINFLRFGWDHLPFIFLQAIKVNLACFAIPLIFLKDKQEKGDLLIVLGLCFGLFERYLLMGSYLSILFYVAVGYLMAKAAHETKGSVASLVMLFFFYLFGL